MQTQGRHYHKEHKEKLRTQGIIENVINYSPIIPVLVAGYFNCPEVISTVPTFISIVPTFTLIAQAFISIASTFTSIAPTFRSGSRSDDYWL